MSKLTFEFDSIDALENFKIWLSESGEQHYWDWMEQAEESGDDYGEDPTVMRFKYDETNVIRTECGRLTK